MWHNYKYFDYSRSIFIQSEMWPEGKTEVLPRTVKNVGGILDIYFVAWIWPQMSVIITNMQACEYIPSIQCFFQLYLRNND